MIHNCKFYKTWEEKQQVLEQCDNVIGHKQYQQQVLVVLHHIHLMETLDESLLSRISSTHSFANLSRFQTSIRRSSDPFLTNALLCRVCISQVRDYCVKHLDLLKTVEIEKFIEVARKVRPDTVLSMTDFKKMYDEWKICLETHAEQNANLKNQLKDAVISMPDHAIISTPPQESQESYPKPSIMRQKSKNKRTKGNEKDKDKDKNVKKPKHHGHKNHHHNHHNHHNHNHHNHGRSHGHSTNNKKKDRTESDISAAIAHQKDINSNDNRSVIDGIASNLYGNKRHGRSAYVTQMILPLTPCGLRNRKNKGKQQQQQQNHFVFSTNGNNEKSSKNLSPGTAIPNGSSNNRLQINRNSPLSQSMQNLKPTTKGKKPNDDSPNSGTTAKQHKTKIRKGRHKQFYKICFWNFATHVLFCMYLFDLYNNGDIGNKLNDKGTVFVYFVMASTIMSIYVLYNLKLFIQTNLLQLIMILNFLVQVYIL